MLCISETGIALVKQRPVYMNCSMLIIHPLLFFFFIIYFATLFYLRAFIEAKLFVISGNTRLFACGNSALLYGLDIYDVFIMC